MTTCSASFPYHLIDLMGGFRGIHQLIAALQDAQRKAQELGILTPCTNTNSATGDN